MGNGRKNPEKTNWTTDEGKREMTKRLRRGPFRRKAIQEIVDKIAGALKKSGFTEMWGQVPPHSDE